MKRLREFKGTATRIDYDAGRCTFDSVVEIHPFLDHAEAADDLTASAATSTKAASDKATVPVCTKPACSCLPSARAKACFLAALGATRDQRRGMDMKKRFEAMQDPSFRFEIWDTEYGEPVVHRGRLLSLATAEQAERVAAFLNNTGATPEADLAVPPQIPDPSSCCASSPSQGAGSEPPRLRLADGSGIQHFSSGSAYSTTRPGEESDARQPSPANWSPRAQ
jgi:hypothetical protein